MAITYNTSNINEWNATESDIISRASVIVGGTGIGDSINANEYSLARKCLNSIIKSLVNETSPFWKLEETSFSVPLSGGNTYTLSNDIVDIEKLQVLNGSKYDDLTKLSRSDFFSIEDKDATSSLPTHFTINRKLGGYELIFYPKPTANITCYSLVTKYCYDSDTNGENLDFPVHWLEYLVYALAEKLSDIMHLPLSERGYLRNTAEELKQKALGSYTQDSGTTFIQGLFDYGRTR